MSERAQILERRDVDLKTFREEVVAGNRPVVLRGVVADWPAVRAGRESPRALADYLKPFDIGKPLALLCGKPDIGGHFFYREDLRALNFERERALIAQVLERLLGLAGEAAPPAVYIESTPVHEWLPGFERANQLKSLLGEVLPRIWIGNRITVQTHFDLSSNVACVVGGRRRFTLFPPDQLPNLYVGPFEFSISGPPVSMVPLKNPDLARYPRFAAALAAAQSAELGPGDAIYIPYGWWHHVESLEAFNVLVNYWWTESQPGARPFDCLLHATLAIGDLPPAERAVWKTLFEQYVFRDHGDPLAHLPVDRRGLLGAPAAERARTIREILAKTFGRD
jgi:hypothetical protein